MLSIKNLTKEYKGEADVTTALKGITFQVQAGEFVAITGASGSGKSTLLHILGILDRPTSGQYYLDGKDVSLFTDEEQAQYRNKKIGFVFQSFNLLKRTSVLDNVKLPLYYSGEIKDKDADYLADLAIRAVNIDHRKNHLSNQLSGGEQQRAAIARALVNNPTLILADEPTGNLDTKNSHQIMDIFERLNNKGQTIVLITHENEIANRAKRIIQMRDGKIIEDTKIK